MQELTEKLKFFGLDGEECKLLVCLASNKPLKASELSNLTNIDRARTYRILKKLQSLGLIEATLQKPALFVSIPMSVALDGLIKNMIEKVEKCVEEKTIILSELEKIPKSQPMPQAPRFNVIQGRELALKTLERLSTNAKTEINIMTTKNGLIRTLNSKLEIAYKNAVKRGVRIRWISKFDEKKDSEIIKAFEGLGEIQNIEIPKGFRINIFDGKYMLISSTEDDSTNLNVEKDNSLLINDPNIANGINFFFELVWRIFPKVVT
jgi:sugar-specific transcriptional regulator TrmB